MNNDNIIKLFYQNSKLYKGNVENWGNSKGSTYNNVCVVLNQNTYNLYKENNLKDLKMATRNKLYEGQGLPQELSKSDFFKGVTAPRNKELIRVFKDVDLIENIGSGILRILKAYDKSCFIFMDNFLRVLFKYRENPFKYEKTTNQETTQENYAMLNETQIRIIKLIKENPSITQKEIAKELKMTRDGVKYNMNVLKEMSIISREGSTKKGKWQILK